MVTISNDTLRQNVYKTFWDYLSGLTFTTQPTIYGGFPDLVNITFPCIIIEPISVSEDTYTIDTSRDITTKDISINVHVFAKANKDLDIVSDGLSSSVRSKVFNGITLVNIRENNNSMIEANAQKVKGKSITFNYRRR